MKRAMPLLLALVLLVSIFTGCGNLTPPSASTTTVPATTAPATATETSAVETSAPAASAEPVAKPIVLKFGHERPTTHAAHISAVYFADKVKELSKGTITVEVYPNGELGDPPALLEQTILGSIDMCIPTPGSLDKYSTKFFAIGVPFAFDSYEHAHKVIDDYFTPWASADLPAVGIMHLANWEFGFRQLTTNKKPVESPADMKGVKVRVPPNAILESLMASIGGNPQKIAYSELYMSLKQGVVDAEENPVSTIYSDKLYEVQKNLAITNHYYDYHMMVIGKPTWDKLTPDQQEILKTASKEAGDLMRKTVVESENGMIKELEKLGMTVTRPDLAPFREMMAPANKLIVDHSGQEAYNKVMEMIKAGR